ncbi:MAG: prepilin-type N-terminal cleavage/methylation domain-containing protein [Planctomycetes bacterium]|jgi:prepilin-type N-terminal cleavage/methylation domain-containing protein/prepilin-type processing-associated H-X9-DG protein|nr:prepilin-type N-terminal cleavage/methylation domain-containing protein [Planctomycetota bacterium]
MANTGKTIPASTIRPGAGRGFTLIELLVVIAIISLLASLILPSLNRATGVARQVVCLANQHAVAVTFPLYAQDWDGLLPHSENFWLEACNAGEASLPEDPFEYNRRTLPDILFCPSDPDPWPQPHMTGEMQITSFFVNGALNAGWMSDVPTITFGLFGGEGRLEAAPTPSVHMALGDSCSYQKILDLDHPNVQAAFAEAGESLTQARTRMHRRSTTAFFHNGRTNLTFADGHGETVAGEAVDPWPPELWPAGAKAGLMRFFPNLALPSAQDAPPLWGLDYVE